MTHSTTLVAYLGAAPLFMLSTETVFAFPVPFFYAVHGVVAFLATSVADLV